MAKSVCREKRRVSELNGHESLMESCRLARGVPLSAVSARTLSSGL